MPPKRKDKETTDDNDELISLKMFKVLMSQQESAFKSLVDSLIEFRFLSRVECRGSNVEGEGKKSRVRVKSRG